MAASTGFVEKKYNSPQPSAYRNPMYNEALLPIENITQTTTELK
jgi:hypothetical protein